MVEYTNCISPNECPEYDTKQSEDEAWGMQSTLLLPSLPGPFCPGMVAPDRVLFSGQIEMFDI